jgi:hypothetical protein
MEVRTTELGDCKPAGDGGAGLLVLLAELEHRRAKVNRAAVGSKNAVKHSITGTDHKENALTARTFAG